ncbi:MAG: glycosyltransferase family 4 protein [bacterium]|nr:glycosyltransferase family 4 protein [bacterium]
MKVVILSPSNKSVGGVERFSLHLKKVYQDAGHEVLVLSAEPSATWFRFFRLLGLHAPSLGWVVGNCAKKEGFDVLVTNGLLGWNVKKRLSINIEHGTFAASADRIDKGRNTIKWFIKKYIWGNFEMLAAKRATHVVAVSEETKESVKKYYSVDSVDVINNGVDGEFFNKKDKVACRKQLGLPLDKNILLFVGRFEYAKGKVILEEVKRYGESQGMLFVVAENYSPEELVLLYNASDVFIFPSIHEGCSLALLEAMTCGLPFLASPVGIVPELEKEGLFRDCIVVEQSGDAYINKLKSILTLSNTEKEQLSKSIRNYTMENYSFERFNDRHLLLLKSIMQKQNVK